MPILDILALYGIFEGLLIIIGIASIRYANKYLHPTKDSEPIEKRNVYYREVFYKEINPSLVNFFKKYHIYLMSNQSSSERFQDLFENIKVKINLEKGLKEIERIVSNSKVYEDLTTLVVNSETMKNLISGCKSFYNYISTFRKLKATGVLCFIFIIVNLISLLALNTLEDIVLAYNISLLINIIILIILSIIFLFIAIGYYKIYTINKEFYNETWISPKKN